MSLAGKEVQTASTHAQPSFLLQPPCLCASVSIFIMFLPLPQCSLLTVPSRPVTTKIKMAKDPSRKAAHGKGGGTDLNSLATPKHTPGLSSFWGSKKVEVPQKIKWSEFMSKLSREQLSYCQFV